MCEFDTYTHKHENGTWSLGLYVRAHFFLLLQNIAFYLLFIVFSAFSLIFGHEYHMTRKYQYQSQCHYIIHLLSALVLLETRTPYQPPPSHSAHTNGWRIFNYCQNFLDFPEILFKVSLQLDQCCQWGVRNVLGGDAYQEIVHKYFLWECL